MLVRLKDARTILCPMTAANPNPATSGCSGNKCMAWRWYPVNQVYDTINAKDRKAVIEPARGEVPPTWTWVPYEPCEDWPAHWLESPEDYNARRCGYCGLAGKMEPEREAWERD